MWQKFFFQILVLLKNLNMICFFFISLNDFAVHLKKKTIKRAQWTWWSKTPLPTENWEEKKTIKKKHLLWIFTVAHIFHVNKPTVVVEQSVHSSCERRKLIGRRRWAFPPSAGSWQQRSAGCGGGGAVWSVSVRRPSWIIPQGESRI